MNGNGYGSRKFVLSLLLLIFSFLFGVWCTIKGVELSDAAVLIAAATASQAAYMTANVWQRKVENGTNKPK